MKNKLTAFLTAGVMLASMASIPPVQAADAPSMDSVIGTLPDWTPMNFTDAMELYNKYGKSHVEDNFICLIRPIELNKKDFYKSSLFGSMTMLNTPACTSPATFKLEIPEKPDSSDEKALKEYDEYCKKLGLPTDDYSIWESYANGEVQYAFQVQMFRVLEGYDLTVEWLEDLGENYKKVITETFTFENQSGYTEETDIYSWLPDSPAEYNALVSYGCASVRNNHIAYCADWNESTGPSLKMEQSGKGVVEKVIESDCNGFDLYSLVEPVRESSYCSVTAYKPVSDGIVDIKWTIGRLVTLGIYEIKDNCSIVNDFSSGVTEFTFIDKDPDELIDIPEDAGFTKQTIQQDYTSELFGITDNPCTVGSINAYDPKCSYSFNVITTDGYYDEPEFEITSVESNRIKVTCKLKHHKKATDLPAGATRVTLYDKETGELIPNEFMEDRHFSFMADIGIKNPNVPGGWMLTNPIYRVDSNPWVDESDLASFYKADRFSISSCNANDDLPELTYYDNGSMDVVFRINYTAPASDFEFNAKTGELTKYKGKDKNIIIPSEIGGVPVKKIGHYAFSGCESITSVTIPGGVTFIDEGAFYMCPNLKSVTVPKSVETIEMWALGFNDDNYIAVRKDDFVIKGYRNTEAEIYAGDFDIEFIDLGFETSGDINADGIFNIADVVLLQKWLLAAPDVELSDWKAADLCEDGKLDVFDLCLMKRELINKQNPTYVEPDNRCEYPTSLHTLKNGLKLYLGPDESYRSVARLPVSTHLLEIGYQNNNDDWIFTEYNGKYGWIKLVNDDNNPTVGYDVFADKPVIYLYPEQETDVHVELELTSSDLATTYPKYNNGWDVIASPDGKLLNKADGTHHRYLFWESVNCRTRFDFSKGFCVAGSDTESFLKEKLTYMGLTEEEMNEFIVYWLPRMERNAYNLIAFQGDAYTDSAKLNITPEPDSLCRIFMTYVPLENAVDIESQQLETFERKGFTVVEWGGSEIKS